MAEGDVGRVLKEDTGISMTREEAVKFAEHAVNMTDIPAVKEFYRMAAAALAPPTQEQVNKAWRGEWMPVGDDAFYSKCSKCGKMAVGKRLFCPNCGAPMTDEAVEMVMERWEALYENP